MLNEEKGINEGLKNKGKKKKNIKKKETFKMNNKKKQYCWPSIVSPT